jgi:hypothetical protein
MIWRVTNLRRAKILAANLRRWNNHYQYNEEHHARDIRQEGNDILVERDKKPWAELAGHMTHDTQILVEPVCVPPVCVPRTGRRTGRQGDSSL